MVRTRFTALVTDGNVSRGSGIGDRGETRTTAPASVSGLTPLQLRDWLEWAGARLVAMPVGRIKPAGVTVVWPEYSQNTFEILDFRAGLSVRAAAPSASEIPIMEEILSLPNLCSEIHIRRVLHTRALVHPLNRRYIYKWTRVAELLHTNRDMVRRWHARGLREVTAKADPTKICRISQFFAAAPL